MGYFGMPCWLAFYILHVLYTSLEITLKGQDMKILSQANMKYL